METTLFRLRPGVDASILAADFLLSQNVILTLSVNGEDVRLMLWDTAGQEEFDCITRAYYRYLYPTLITR